MEAPPQQTGDARRHHRRGMAAQLCLVVAPAAMKHGCVHTTGAVHWSCWASLVSGIGVARHLRIEWE